MARADTAIAIDDATRKAQADASNPRASAWVSANAGSGKTFVLSQRVIRLLLAGTDPGRILCLTFTKAAAAEMAKRVFDRLGEWTTLSDTALRQKIAEMEGKRPDAAKLAEARRLFARALETPGGLKIQTIHAFCERLLHQFPFEANVAGHFEVLDQRDADALADTARRTVLARAAADTNGPLGRALSTVLASASDLAHELAVKEFVDKRDRVRAWIVAAGSLEHAIEELREALGLEPGETAAGLRAAVLTE
ncbi:MAG: AAA family ATPase, partial [Bauldia sp.]